MITLESDHLTFRFPEVHEDAECTIGFQRTLRIPDDGRDYPLPPGLGQFPLRHLDDHAGRIPEAWLKRGGVIMPMHQAEAMWLWFGGGRNHGGGYPCAVKVATGKIDAITGEAWVNRLNRDPQDYLVVPDQPWLDGYCIEKGVIRQFVAMPLGEGYSVEEQISGAGVHGGMQIIVYPMKAERYEALQKYVARATLGLAQSLVANCDMGLAPGGRMKQEIYEDSYGLDAWDQRHFSRCFVTITNSVVWAAISGERPPVKPPSAEDYTKAGLPWFDYYDADAKALEGAGVLAELKSVTEAAKEKGEAAPPDNGSIDVERVIPLRRRDSPVVREADIGAQ